MRETESMKYNRVSHEGRVASQSCTLEGLDVYHHAGRVAMEQAREHGYMGNWARVFAQAYVAGLDQLVKIEQR